MYLLKVIRKICICFVLVKMNFFLCFYFFIKVFIIRKDISIVGKLELYFMNFLSKFGLSIFFLSLV